MLAPLGSDKTYGFDAKYKRAGPTDLFVVPLFEALNASPARGDAVFVFDKATPYRVVVETLFTASQAGLTHPHLAVGHGPVVGHIELKPPTKDILEKRAESLEAQMLAAFGGDAGATGDAGKSAADESPWLDLSVVVATDGYAMKKHGDGAVPGCTTPGRATSIKKRGDAYDVAALAACAARLRSASPAFASERAYTMSAAASVPFEAIVDAVDALRAAPDGTQLFTEVSFGLPR